MSLETYIAFAVAAMIVLVIPGPTIILVISQAVAHGRRAVLPLAAGVTLGDFTAMTFSLLGLGAVLAASAALFSVLKWIGAGYLVYLGIKLWVAGSEMTETGSAVTGATNNSLFKSAFIVTALNPKSIAFFVAFLPQFVNPRGKTMNQLVILGSTFLVLAFLNSALYAFFAGRLRDVIQDSRVSRWFNRCGGTALIGAGIFTATIQRSS
jgi:homoserine/homoserine lactone efflux protein